MIDYYDYSFALFTYQYKEKRRMEQADDRIRVSQLLHNVLEIVDNIPVNNPEIANIFQQYALYQMPVSHLSHVLDYLKSEQGQANLRSLRNSIDGVLDA